MSYLHRLGVFRKKAFLRKLIRFRIHSEEAKFKHVIDDWNKFLFSFYFIAQFDANNLRFNQKCLLFFNTKLNNMANKVKDLLGEVSLKTKLTELLNVLFRRVRPSSSFKFNCSVRLVDP